MTGFLFQKPNRAACVSVTPCIRWRESFLLVCVYRSTTVYALDNLQFYFHFKKINSNFICPLYLDKAEIKKGSVSP